MKFVKSIIVAAFLINPISSLALSIDEQKIKVTTDRACQLLKDHGMKLVAVYCVYMISQHTKEIGTVSKNTNPTLAKTVDDLGISVAQLLKDSPTLATKAELKNFIPADKFTAVETLTNQHAELLKIKSATPTTEIKQQ